MVDTVSKILDEVSIPCLEIRSLALRAGFPQAIKPAARGADEDLGLAVAVEVGEHGLADGAIQRDFPEDVTLPRALTQRVEISVGASHHDLETAVAVEVGRNHAAGWTLQID